MRTNRFGPDITRRWRAVELLGAAEFGGPVGAEFRRWSSTGGIPLVHSSVCYPGVRIETRRERASRPPECASTVCGDVSRTGLPAGAHGVALRFRFSDASCVHRPHPRCPQDVAAMQQIKAQHSQVHLGPTRTRCCGGHLDVRCAAAATRSIRAPACSDTGAGRIEAAHQWHVAQTMAMAQPTGGTCGASRIPQCAPNARRC